MAPESSFTAVSSTPWVMPFFPPELVSTVIDFVWEDCRESRRFNDINACALSSRALYRETRLRMFSKLELREAGASPFPMRIHTGSSARHGSRSTYRFTQFRALLQENSQLGNYVTSLSLAFPWDHRLRKAATGQSYMSDLPLVVKQLRRLRHLSFETNTRLEWQNLGEPVQEALRLACMSGKLATVRFTKIYNLPSSLLTVNRLAALRLRDCQVSYECSTTVEPTPASGGGGAMSRLYVEYSGVNDMLARCPSVFHHLRFLHAKIAGNWETQRIIDASCGTLEEFSCEGKAMTRLTGIGASEGAAGVGPFSFKECSMLRLLQFRYSTPRGNVSDFFKAVCISIEHADMSLEELKLSFQCSTETDIVNLLSSPFWSSLDTLYSLRGGPHRIHVHLETGRPKTPRFPVALKSLLMADGQSKEQLILDALEKTRSSLPFLVKSKAISFSLDTTNCPRIIQSSPIYKF